MAQSFTWVRQPGPLCRTAVPEGRAAGLLRFGPMLGDFRGAFVEIAARVLAATA
jgi:hypothetical protein